MDNEEPRQETEEVKQDIEITETLEKPKKKGRPPLSEKQKQALQAGRVKNLERIKPGILHSLGLLEEFGGDFGGLHGNREIGPNRGITPVAAHRQPQDQCR